MDILKTKEFWGSILMVISIIGAYFGLNVSSDQQMQLSVLLSSLVTAIFGIVGLLMVIFGAKKTQAENKFLKGIVDKSLKGRPLGFQTTMIELATSLLGKDASAALSCGAFLMTQEWEDLYTAIQKAKKSDKGKLLLDQLEKVL